MTSESNVLKIAGVNIYIQLRISEFSSERVHQNPNKGNIFSCQQAAI